MAGEVKAPPVAKRPHPSSSASDWPHSAAITPTISQAPTPSAHEAIRPTSQAARSHRRVTPPTVLGTCIARPSSSSMSVEGRSCARADGRQRTQDGGTCGGPSHGGPGGSFPSAPRDAITLDQDMFSMITLVC